MIIYDCEIIRAIPQAGVAPLEGIDYCAGWRDFKGMGVSVICAYDYTQDRYRAFSEDNFDAFEDLAQAADWVIGFNSAAFDNRLCQANEIVVPQANSYDLLVAIWKGAGLGAKFTYPTHSGFSLQACSQANFGTQKSGNGASAPIDWQRGKVGTVIDYCLMDVRLTKALVDRVIGDGFVRDPRDATKVIEVVGPEPV